MKYFLVILLIVAVLVGSTHGIRGEIRTCSGFKLDRLEEVRRFVKDPGHADTYANLSVRYMNGRSPMLVLLDDNGVELEQHQLTHMSTEELHNLVQSKGFPKITSPRTNSL